MVKLKDKKITILEYKEIVDEYGTPTVIEQPLPGGENIWAYYRQVSAKEYINLANTNYKVEAIFEINWRNDIDNSMRILFRGEKYNISRIDDFEGYKQDLKIYAYKD